MNAIIETKQLTHIYSAGTPFERGALLEVDFSAMEGEFLGIIGHTGSGQIHADPASERTAEAHRPARCCFHGQRHLGGRQIRPARPVSRWGWCSSIPEYQLFEETVYKDIAFGPKNMGLDEKEVDRRVREAAAFVGLRDDQLEKSPFELSGGQKRRVAIAGVIAMEPDVLILDEPTAGLDPVGVESILGNIRDYHRAHNATVILVSHSMEEVARTVDRLVVVNDGKIPFQGTPRQVFQHGDELEHMGLGVPPADPCIPPAAGHGGRCGPLGVYPGAGQGRPAGQAGQKRKGGGVSGAEGYHPGAVLPGQFPRTPAGPPDQDPDGGAVYHRPVPGQVAL